MKTYEVVDYITTFAFITTLITNSILILFTVFHIKLICKTYKWMIVIFAAIGITFSFTEAAVRPCVHNFNGGFMFFSLNEHLPHGILSLGIAIYAGFSSLLLTFVSVQFIFRCWTLTGSKLIRYFRGFRVIIWMLFVLLPCTLFVICIMFLLNPDDYSDDYMRQEILNIYELSITEIPRFAMIPFDEDGVRWKNLICLAVVCLSLVLDLVIIGYCVLRMRREMNLRLQAMSKRNRRIETQFFKALLAQSVFPLFLLALPTVPVILLPLFNLKISIQSGFLFSLFSLYPPLDSLAMMIIITEYKTCSRSKFLLSDCYQIRVPGTVTQLKRLFGCHTPQVAGNTENSDSDLGSNFQLSTINVRAGSLTSTLKLT